MSNFKNCFTTFQTYVVAIIVFNFPLLILNLIAL